MTKYVHYKIVSAYLLSIKKNKMAAASISPYKACTTISPVIHQFEIYREGFSGNSSTEPNRYSINLPVSASEGCHDKVSQIGWLTTAMCCLTVLEAGSKKSRCQLPLKSVGENSPLPLPRFWCRPSPDPWHSLAFSCITPISICHHMAFFLCLCLHMTFASFY